MAFKGFVKKQENLILSMLLLLALMFFIAIKYDYYFDLNDDVLMKDILAGVYTGMPEGHNIQMLWLISGFISLFYRVVRGLPWYGMFLCACQYGCIFLFAHRSISLCRHRKSKIFLLIAEGVLFLSFMMEHLVCVQYTVTCTWLAATAAFLFLTTEPGLDAAAFIRRNILTVLLVFTSYLIRSEMLLLVLPLICVAGVIRWGSEEKIFTKENFIKYLTVIGLIVLGIGVGQLSHRIAYGSSEWKQFTEFFNNRTELYDFQVLPEYEEHQKFYDSIGLTKNERKLLDNYNFGLDEEIDEKLVGEVAAYAAANRSAEKPFMQRFRAAFGSYVRRMLYPPSHNESDFPWSYLLLFTYVMVFCTVIVDRNERLMVRAVNVVWKLAFLLLVRSVLWIWLIMRNRVPVRISHSMYLMEFCILMGILFIQRFKEKRHSMLVTLLMFAIMGLIILPQSIRDLDKNVADKDRNNVIYNNLYSRLRDDAHKDNFYFMDVYSSVAYTEKMFVNVDNSLANYDIMGGWACKSPLYRKKLSSFGIEDMESALLERGNVFYVQENGADTGWLIEYYKDHGKSVRLKKMETPKGFEIYQVVEVK